MELILSAFLEKQMEMVSQNLKLSLPSQAQQLYFKLWSLGLLKYYPNKYFSILMIKLPFMGLRSVFVCEQWFAHCLHL